MSKPITGVPPLSLDGPNFPDDFGSGPRTEEVLHELPSEYTETREQLVMLDEAVRIGQDEGGGPAAAAASALEDRDTAVSHESNLRQAASDPRAGVTSEQLAASKSAKERASARHVTAMQRDQAVISKLTAARAVRSKVFSHVLATLRSQAGNGPGALQYFQDAETSAEAGTLAIMAAKPAPPVKRILQMVGLAKGETEFADPNAAIHDCRVEINRLRSERKGIEAEHAPIEELRRQAVMKVETLARTTAVKVAVDKNGNVDVLFPKRPTGVTAVDGTRLGVVDVEGLLAHFFRDQVLEDIDRSLDQQFADSEGMTAAQKRKELARIDAEVLAAERVEAAAGWQLVKAGSPASFRADLSPRAILGLA